MQINKIVIVGGGTAGWLSAAYLSANLHNVDITIIDKRKGTPVGVGEGTLTNFEPFLADCGFEKGDWFNVTDATYKSGILFPNWNNQGHEVWHPFFKSFRNAIPNVSVHDLWTQNQHLDFKRFALSFYECSIDDNVVDFDNLDFYAYHVDCNKLVEFIQQRIKHRVTYIPQDVVDIEKDNGKVVKLTLKDEQVIEADLFVDCTGFAGILHDGKEKVDVTGRLFCNTAVAGHVPYKDKESELNPYVISEAVDHGWVWNIPVRTRIGSGLVFDRNITDIDTAKEYFCNYWDNRISPDDLKVIDWTPYYYKEQWLDNVVSVGLSAGFIEPLESTGVSLMMASIAKLCDCISDQTYNQDSKDMFNLQMRIWFEDCIDFVSMHYSGSTRDTEFWKNVRENWTPSVKYNYYKEILANPDYIIPFNGKHHDIFGGSNWSTWMIQMGHTVAERDTGVDKEQSAEILNEVYLTQEKPRSQFGRKHCDEFE